MDNTVLAILAVLLLIFFFGRRIMIMSNPNVKNVSAEEARILIQGNKDMVILDVRTKEEYDRGHIPGAILIPAQELPSRIKELNTYVKKPILVYCASGGRSPGAVNTLLRNSFAPIYHLYSGVSSWKYELQAS